MQWHSRLGLPPASNQEFGKDLEKELQVTPDAAPFSGESHWWTPESPPAFLGGSAATAAAARPPGYARDAGVGLQPASSLLRQLLPCAVPSLRNFDGLGVADGAVRRPSGGVSRPRRRPARAAARGPGRGLRRPRR